MTTDNSQPLDLLRLSSSDKSLADNLSTVNCQLSTVNCQLSTDD
ncbi:hypothetical protein QUB47_10315 [Microcoleus sp. AT9_B5]